MMSVARVFKQTLGFFCIITAALAMAADPAGKIVKLKGAVSIESGKAKKTANEGDKFFVGDTFVTGADGRAKLQFAEGGPAGKNEVVIASGSRLLIEKAGSASSGKTGTSLALQEGSIRSNVNKKYSGEGEDVFKVRTPNAVAGVRGTIFLMNFDKATQSSTLLTQRGKVEFAMGSMKSAVSAGQAIQGSTKSGIGKVVAAEKATLPGAFKDLDKESGGGGTGPASDKSSADGAKNDAPPPALDHETVKTEDKTASSGSSSSSTTASGDTKTADSGTSKSDGTRAPATADTSTSPSTDTKTSSTSPTPTSSTSTKAPAPIGSVATTPPPAPPPVFVPPPVYVPPVNPVTVNQVKQANPNGTIKIPIKDYP